MNRTLTRSALSLGGLAAGAIVALTLTAAPAAAACFESGVGCTHDHKFPKSVLRTLSCDALWTVRNMIYDEKGYCFQSTKAIATFGNEGCTIPAGVPVPFTSIEQTNVSRIKAVEAEKGC